MQQQKVPKMYATVRKGAADDANMDIAGCEPLLKYSTEVWHAPVLGYLA